MISRRSLLAGMSAMAATPLLAAGSGRPDVLVIGAGLSGLYSAMILEEMGATVRVVEGRNRIGGRLYTRFDLPGHPEVGGNTIAAGYGRAIVIARRLGLNLVDYAPRMFGSPPPELVMNGAVIDKRNWSDSPHNPLPLQHRELMPWEILQSRLAGRNPLEKAVDWIKPENAALDIPLYDYLRMQGLSDTEISLGYDTNPYHGDSSRALSALMYLFNDRWVQEQAGLGSELYAVEGGNQRLPQAMAASLKNEVMLDHEVVAIESSRDRANVTFRNGRQMSAAQVICSLPVSKLRDVSISPRVSVTQRRALSALRYQRYSLFFLVPKKAYWEEDGLSPSMWTNGILGNVSAQRFDPDSDAVTGLVVQARGWSGDYLDRLGGAAAGAAIIAEIERLRPAAKGALSFRGWHSWWLDPFAAGNWAVYGPGQVTGVLGAIETSAGRVHFCGEHLGVANRGMEGALESAERAAFAASGADTR